MAHKPVFVKYTWYRNLPIIDQVKIDSEGERVSIFRRLFPFHFQRLRRSTYIEIPFIGLYIHRLYNE